MLAFVADVHVGNHRRFGGPKVGGLNQRARRVLDVLDRAARTARERGATAFVVLGDLLHSDRPEPAVLARTADALRAFGGPVILLLGNHEVTTQDDGDNALAPLARLPQVTVVTSPGLVVVPGWRLWMHPHGAAFTSVDVELVRAAKPDIWCQHAGVADARTPPWLLDSPTAVRVEQLMELCSAAAVPVALAGDWHDRRRWTGNGVEVLQVGALCPTGFDNPGLGLVYGGLALVSRQGGKATLSEVVEIPGPRFVQVAGAEALRRVAMDNPGVVYAEATLPEGEALPEGLPLLGVEARPVRGEDAQLDVAASTRPSLEEAFARAAERGRVRHRAEAISQALTILRLVAPRGVAAPIRVRALSLRAFMSHAASTVHLPEVGLVQISGPNGAGKSALVEAVAEGLWGESLRGASPWAGEDKQALVDVHLEGLRVTRGRKGFKWGITPEDGTATGKCLGSLALLGQPSPGGGGGGGEGTTRTKGQAALESVIGPFDVWRATSVFTSRDVGLFAAASDGARKAILDQVLGGAGLALAVQDVRARLKQSELHVSAAEEALARTTTQLRVLDARWEETHEQLRVAQADLAEATVHLQRTPRPSPVLVPGRLRVEASLEQALLKLDSRLAAMASEARSLTLADGRAAALVDTAQVGVSRVASATCPVCEQSLPETRRAKAAADLQHALAQAEETRRTVRERLPYLDPAELLEEREVLRLRRAQAEEEEARLRRAAEQHRHAEERVEELSARVARLQDTLALLTAKRTDELQVARAAQEQATVQAEQSAILAGAEWLLGQFGVRIELLQDTLGRLEAAANHWLRELGTAVRVQLAEADTARGEDSSARTKLVLTAVVGDSPARPVAALSGGERRRVDIAFLLALAEETGLAQPSTVWFDEVFDAIDDERGIDDVSRCLRRLSETRCVVVITHSQALASSLEAAHRVRVEQGVVREGV